MTHLGLSTCFGTGAALLLQILVVSSESVKCSNPEVTYRDLYFSGNHNQTGVWKTSLGNVKVTIEHEGKPQMETMGSGYWVVSVKLNSFACGSIDTQDKEYIEEKSPTDDHIFEIQHPENPNVDDSEHTKRSGIFGDRNRPNGIFDKLIYERLKRTREELEQTSPRSDDWSTPNDALDLSIPCDGFGDDDGSDTGEHGAPSELRMQPQSWVQEPYFGSSTEYTDYGSAGAIKLYAYSLPWRLAKERCEQDGGHLASVEDAAKVEALLGLFSKNPRVPRTAVLKDQVYVGINDRDEEGVFRTATGELFAPWDASVWAPNEPNDAGGAEDCVTFHVNGTIRDVPCRYSLPFFCEMDVHAGPQIRPAH